MDFQKHFTKLQKIKNTQSKIKPIKIGKQPGTKYCLRCKDFAYNFRPQEVLFVDQISQDF